MKKAKVEIDTERYPSFALVISTWTHPVRGDLMQALIIKDDTPVAEMGPYIEALLKEVLA